MGHSLRRAAAINTQSRLLSALAELKEHGTFTNHAPDSCRIYAFTNHYLISGTNFHCALAADSRDFQHSSNVLAITSDEMLLFIDERGVAPFPRGHFPPGY